MKDTLEELMKDTLIRSAGITVSGLHTNGKKG